MSKPDDSLVYYTKMFLKSQLQYTGKESEDVRLCGWPSFCLHINLTVSLENAFLCWKGKKSATTIWTTTILILLSNEIFCILLQG